MNRLTEHQQTNQAYWDSLVDIHAAQNSGGEGYRVREFLAGDCILDPLVRGEIGDIAGLSLLHLQCHFGLDTLSLARLGASVTGVDFSPKGVATARQLSEQSGVPGRFIEGRVEDVPSLIDEPFDRVFTSWGALNWLGDLGAWAGVIDHTLKPGGVFYIADAHPLVLAFDDEAEPGDRPLPIIYDYLSSDQPIGLETANDYADEGIALTVTRTFEWSHGLGDIVTRLCDVGLRIEFLREHNVLAWRGVKGLVRQDEYFHRLPDGWPDIPLSFSIRAVKDG